MQQPPQKKIRWLPAAVRKMFGIEYIEKIDRTGYEYSETVTTTSLTGNGIVGARSRQAIYAKYQQMAGDPLVSGAIRLHVTAALGGHETSGDIVFIEARPEAKADPASAALVLELSEALSPIFNRIAIPAAYNAAIYGDAYARMYTKDRTGIEDVSIDEMLLPPLVIPYEQGQKTRICLVAVGEKAREKLTMDQIARVKLPRLIYTPQPVAIEKAWRVAITENDIAQLPLMPGLVGGSFLADAEYQYNNFAAALSGLVGQRVLDSIDESIFTAQVTGMTGEQRQAFLKSLTKMLTKSKAVADEAVRTGRPVLQRIRHILPVWGEKQVVGIQGVNSGGATGGGRAGNISIDDVMFHAKLLCGALGIDISMLGFADLMSGGLGDGGFFRTSAQAAERSRTIRVALSEFFNDIIDVHMIKKTGSTYDPKDRPWQVNFYGTISALETERVKTQLDAINAGTLLAQCFAMVKDAGLDEKAMAHMFERVMKLDAADAKMYAKAIVAAKKEAEAKEAAQGGFGAGAGGGSFPSGDDDGDPKPFGKDEPPPGAPKPVPVGAE
jgi:hypothetical protein